MPKLKIQGFDGARPRVSSTMLGENQATQADNVKLYSGELRYWRGPSLDYNPALAPVIRSIFKIYRNTSSAWFISTNDVDLVLGPLADTTEIRMYYTGDGTPRKTNWTMMTSGAAPYPSDYMPMGVPAPTTAPTFSVVSSSGTIAKTVAYVYTYVSTFGTVKEESAPSPASALITLTADQAAQVSGFATAPTTASKYNITALRIYRTIDGTTTGSGYAFVTEIPVTPSTGVATASSFTDSLSASQLGEALATSGWTTPPASLTGIVSMANGILAGFVGNTVYFSEPYFPHAWPVSYSLTVADNIVGLGSYGNQLVVVTERNPYLITGTHPDNMSQEKLPLLEPGVSKRSITSDQFGVTYASPNGLVAIGNAGRGNMTEALFRRDEWQQYVPSTLIGAVFDGKYVGCYTPAGTTTNRAMLLSRDDIPALSFLSLNATAMHVDRRNGLLYFVSALDNKIYQMDADDVNPYVFEWKSKRFVLPAGTTFSAAKVDADYDTTSASSAYQAQLAQQKAYNQTVFSQNLLGALNTTTVNTRTVDGSIMYDFGLPQDVRSIQAFVYGDGGALQASLTFSSFDALRLPAFRSREIQIKLSGNANVRSVSLATTVAELRE